MEDFVSWLFANCVPCLLHVRSMIPDTMHFVVVTVRGGWLLSASQFNVSVREEAEKTFPPHADCKGVHQLAFRHVGRRFQGKLVQDLKEPDVQSFLKTALGKKVNNNSNS